MTYYRVRTRINAVGGKCVTIKDKIPTLKQAYECIIENAKGTPRKYYIDEIEPKLFSKLSAKEAQKRLEEIKYNEN